MSELGFSVVEMGFSDWDSCAEKKLIYHRRGRKHTSSINEWN